MYKKAWCTCKVIVLLIKPIVFLTFSLPSTSLDLKVPINTKTPKVVGNALVNMLALQRRFVGFFLFFI